MNAEFGGWRNTDRHHSTATRAWCDCGEWCSRTLAYSCCTVAMAAENPCPCCDGTGVRDGGEQ